MQHLDFIRKIDFKDVKSIYNKERYLNYSKKSLQNLIIFSNTLSLSIVPNILPKITFLNKNKKFKKGDILGKCDSLFNINVITSENLSNSIIINTIIHELIHFVEYYLISNSNHSNYFYETCHFIESKLAGVKFEQYKALKKIEGDIGSLFCKRPIYNIMDINPEDVIINKAIMEGRAYDNR